MKKQLSRRSFLTAAAPAALGAGLIGTRAWTSAASAALGANEALSFGVVGCGGRGQYLMGLLKKVPGTRVVAVCDVNKTRAEAARKIADEKAEVYGDFRKLMANKAVDAVIVATTGHWHVLPGIEACAAGKDVYAEKPIGTSIGEGRALVKAARKHDRIVQVGTQQHSWDHYIKAVKIIQSGVLGDISNVHVWDLENFYPGWGSPADSDPPADLDWEFFVGPSPMVAYNVNRYLHHYFFYDYGGAWQLDWAVHHYDIVHWAMGVNAPVSAMGLGGKFAFPKDNTQWPDTFNGACEYPAGPVAKAGFLMNYTFRGGSPHPIEGRSHGKAFYGTNGALVIDRSGFQIHSGERDGKKIIEEQHSGGMGEERAVIEHLRRFVACVAARKQPIADIEVGHMASNPGHLMNIALRVGRKVRWDAAKEQIIDDPEADRMVTKKYRAPWALPA